MTRLLIGANPFGGYSHQTPARDVQMREYHTVDRIKETWARAEAAGINCMVTNNETPHVIQAVREYLSAGGRLQWIAQMNGRVKPDIADAVQEAVDIGCKAMYFHGGQVDDFWQKRDEKTLASWIEAARKHNILVGVAGHAPEVHRWVDRLGLVDFHTVCFFNCGSIHAGKGERFDLSDIWRAVQVIRELNKPCIAYKVMGAGRIDARMALEFAYTNIKPNDVVNVGMYRGDRDDMVEVDAALVQDILASKASN